MIKKWIEYTDAKTNLRYIIQISRISFIREAGSSSSDAVGIVIKVDGKEIKIAEKYSTIRSQLGLKGRDK